MAKEKIEIEPVIPSITMFKVPNDDFAWRCQLIKTQGNKVVSREDVCKPNIRAIVEEQFRIAVVKTIFNQGR